ncbi:PREDICTED: uncharacterized protein LOC109227712 [Nicotiana attenuata]|uniref:uncharacterized protein LOC109227712 n=1 Tax=Nicotiana attenuata TaxID=49451 RepID=UPI00090582C3|nr:PREDICTED: uncharacterized protein LOC109227712 [Nicotiana attenuata]
MLRLVATLSTFSETFSLLSLFSLFDNGNISIFSGKSTGKPASPTLVQVELLVAVWGWVGGVREKQSWPFGRHKGLDVGFQSTRVVFAGIAAAAQETRWAWSKARNTDGYKLWYSGVVRGKNGVGILVDRDLREFVVEVRRVNDRLMFIKLVIGVCTLNVVSAYALQAGLDEEVKRRFWEGLDEIVRSIPPTERLFIGGDFNGHIGAAAGSYGEVHGGFGFADRNGGGTSLLDFAKAFELVITNSTFPKREEHLVTFRSSAVKTHIDYLLLRRCDRGLCKDCKVIPGETLATQHRLLVMDIGIMMKRKKRYARG